MLANQKTVVDKERGNNDMVENPQATSRNFAARMAEEPMLRFFGCEHVPDAVANGIGQRFTHLAEAIIDGLPACSERTESLRRLLDAKTAAVRTAFSPGKQPKPGDPGDGELTAMQKKLANVHREKQYGDVLVATLKDKISDLEDKLSNVRKCAATTEQQLLKANRQLSKLYRQLEGVGVLELLDISPQQILAAEAAS